MCALTAALIAPTVPCSAADFPEKPVRFIVPFPPGGGTDALARILAAKISESWGQQVIIDNRGGAQGSLGVGVDVLSSRHELGDDGDLPLGRSHHQSRCSSGRLFRRLLL